MVHISLIQAQLSKLGVKLSRWYQAELRELQHVLFDHEEIVSIVPGRYFAGYALLVATDQRLLLIDKRTFFLTVDDIRYDMIAETDFSSRLVDATVQIYTLNKQHRFTTFKYKRQLRELTNYVQRRVMDLRQPDSNDRLRGQYAHVSSFLPSANHIHPLPEPKSLTAPLHSKSLGRIVGAAAMAGANRIGYRPRMSHISQVYTGPSFLSGIANNQD
jgi:hypothetical protein